MSNERLGTDKVRKLVNCVRRRRQLWDFEDTSYKDKRAAVRAWKEVSEEMGIPVPVLKAKWKNMRDMFNREVRKNPGPVTGPEDYTGRWCHFSSLCFLLKPIERLETHYFDMVDQNCDDEEDNKAYILNVGAEYLNNGNEDNSSDRLNDDEFDDVPEPRARKFKHSTDDADDDYDIMFLKSLAPYLRSLSPVRKLQVRNQIQNIFLEKIKKDS